MDEEKTERVCAIIGAITLIIFSLILGWGFASMDHTLPNKTQAILMIKEGTPKIETGKRPDIEIIRQSFTISIEEEAEPVTWVPSEEDIVYLAKTLYGECRGEARYLQEAVCWCVLNRCDSRGKTVKEIVTTPHKFDGYHDYNPVRENLRQVAIDVLTWHHDEEVSGKTSSNRVLPVGYEWFLGDGKINHFYNEWPKNGIGSIPEYIF